MSHANARIRSKATLFVGRRTKDLSLPHRSLQEPDSRVRANAIEAMFGCHAPAIHDFLLEAVRDETPGWRLTRCWVCTCLGTPPSYRTFGGWPGMPIAASAAAPCG